MDDDDKPTFVIICVPEDWEHTPDSVLIKAMCGHMVWIGPTSKSKLDGEEGVRAKCLPCMNADPPPPDTEFAVLRGSLEEIDKHEGEASRAKAERMARLLGFRTL